MNLYEIKFYWFIKYGNIQPSLLFIFLVDSCFLIIKILVHDIGKYKIECSMPGKCRSLIKNLRLTSQFKLTID